MKNIIITIVSVFAFTVVQAQEKSNAIVETSFKVEGVCMMCKKRIEDAALRTKGVKQAEWNKKTEDLKVVYNSKKVTEEEIHQSVAEQGHQTSLIAADTTAYSKLPSCCLYKGDAECNDK